MDNHNDVYSLILSDPENELRERVYDRKVKLRLVFEWRCSEWIWEAAPRLINTKYTVHGRKKNDSIELFLLDNDEEAAQIAETPHIEYQLNRAGYRVSVYKGPMTRTEARHKTIHDALCDFIIQDPTKYNDYSVLLAAANGRHLLVILSNAMLCDDIRQSYRTIQDQLWTTDEHSIMGIIVKGNVEYVVDVEDERWDAYFSNGDLHVDIGFKEDEQKEALPSDGQEHPLIVIPEVDSKSISLKDHPSKAAGEDKDADRATALRAKNKRKKQIAKQRRNAQKSGNELEHTDAYSGGNRVRQTDLITLPNGMVLHHVYVRLCMTSLATYLWDMGSKEAGAG